jgi:2-keto-4-pentenoate hydratase/2-oxohepta-3-ene-1,7-dioic acid hydratase in catechol pathway
LYVVGVAPARECNSQKGIAPTGKQMKLASIKFAGRPVYGRVEGDELRVPAAEFLDRYPTLASLVAANAYAEILATNAAISVPVAEAVYEPVIPAASKIICVGVNFMAHMLEMGRPEPDYPLLFTRFADTLVGHGGALTKPRNSDNYDFEGELAFVIGREAHHVSAADALDYVAGYTCFMDGSMRDYQHHTTQVIAGKNFLRSGACGPWLVTADEIPDPSALELQTRLNGEQVQSAPIKDLKFDVPCLIEYISSFCPLRPGDIISTGTPSGVGYARDPQLWMQPGDIIEVEIKGIGVLRNRVESE